MRHAKQLWRPMFATLIVAVVSVTAQAQVAFNETWSITGSQATTDGETFADYAAWTFSEATATNSNVRVDTAGILNLAKGGATNTLGGIVTPTSLGLASPFDVSISPLTLSVEAERGYNAGSSNTNSNIGAFIGDVALVFHPGSSGGFHRIEQINADLTTNSVLMPNTNMGFDPGIDGSTSNTGFTELLISVSEKDIDEYTFDYIITDLVDGDIYTNSIDILKTDVGALDQTGVRFSGGLDGSDGNFRNFSITQNAVPEPSTFALWIIFGLGLAGFGYYRARRVR